jgi:CubicO group peptidase (beta-lactamase class C family)
VSVAGGTAVVVLATPTSFGEVVAIDLASGVEGALTAHGTFRGARAPKAAVETPGSAAEPEDAAKADVSDGPDTGGGGTGDDVELYVRQEREFAISDGTTVQSWLIRDPSASGPQPLLLDIHGGPHNAWNGAADPAHLYHQELAARGWTVLIVNPRASDGYGEAFYTGTMGAWGTSDAGDFLEPVDALVAEGIADPARLAVTGYSYGGYMTCYLTSRDRRFAAAVAGGVVSDLTSMAGTSDFGHMLSTWELGTAETGEASPREPNTGGATVPEAGGATVLAGATRVSAAAARGAFAAMSPLSQVGDVTTPTLILQGGADLRCPVGQAQQWFTALREQGVPARLVLYPGASHLFILDGAPSHRIDYNNRVVDWVEQYASETKRPAIDAAYWEQRLAALAEKHKVPGASLGILRLGTKDGSTGGQPDEVTEVAYGYANWPAKVEATTDTLFQIGSMSKVWTATLAMQLVDEGKLDLDAPVAEVLPELRLADPEVVKTVSMRHLLNHTSGIDGDVFTDTGRGDDCVEKYVALLSEQKQNHPLGVTWSYCNAGFVLAGRVIEKLTGLTWDEALKQRLYKPLGLTHTATLAEEVLLHRAAAGHVDVTNDPVLAPVWQLPRSLGPAGLICSTPADVLAFARMHLTGGLAADGTRVLSEQSAKAMTELEADLPDKYSLGDSWGIGWIRFGWDGRRLVGHDGNTIGQAAFLRVLPDPDNPGAGIAVTLLTNGGHSRDMHYDLYTEVFAELAGVAMPPAIQPPAEPVDADITPHLGNYERAGVLMEVLPRTDKHDGPTLRTTVTGPLAAMVPDPVDEYAMTPVRPDLWLVREPGTETWAPVTFYALPSGEKYLHFGVRATPKVV